MKTILRPVADRFWEKVQKTDTCWLWRGPIKGNGYGVISLGRRSEGYAYVHRLSWEWSAGPIRDGLWVLHRCDIRNCVNPDHLFLGTQQDNLADMKAKHRGRNGGVRGESNGRAVLDRAKVQMIRERHVSHETIASLARAFGVGETTVRHIVKGRNWRDDVSVRPSEVLHVGGTRSA